MLSASVSFSQTTSSIIAGGGGDYDTITDWEADLGTGSQIGECTGTFDEDVTINDSDPDDITLTAASGEEHDGTRGSGVGFINTAVASDNVQVLRSDVTIEWLEFTSTQTVGRAPIEIGSGSDITIQNMLIYDVESVGAIIYGIRVGLNVARTGIVLQNNMIFDMHSTSNTCMGIYIEGAGAHTVSVINNTIHNSNTSTGSGYGILLNATNATVTAFNNMSTSNATADYQADAGTLTQSYNLASDATADGTGSVDSGDPSYVSTTGGSEDLHIDSDSDGLDAGTNTGAPSDDIDGDSRPQNSTVDMGADELVSAGEAATPATRGKFIRIPWR